MKRRAQQLALTTTVRFCRRHGYYETAGEYVDCPTCADEDACP